MQGCTGNVAAVSQALTVSKGNVPLIPVSTNPEFIESCGMRSGKSQYQAGRMEFRVWVTVLKENVLLISLFGLTTQLVDWLASSFDTATCTGHQTSRSSCTVDVSVVQSVFKAQARLFLLAVSVLGAAYLSVLRDNTLLSVFRGRVSVHQDGVLVCTSPNRRQTCSQCSLSQMINMACSYPHHLPQYPSTFTYGVL